MWHPDRFDSDPRLRKRAEDQLARLNEAYSTLQDYSPPETLGAPPQPDRAGSSPHQAQTRPPYRASFPRLVLGPFLYPLLGLFLVLLIGYPTLRYLIAHTSTPPPATSQPRPLAAPAVVQPPADVPELISNHPATSDRRHTTIESICSRKKRSGGPAAYVRCLEQHLDQQEKSASPAPSRSPLNEGGP